MVRCDVCKYSEIRMGQIDNGFQSPWSSIGSCFKYGNIAVQSVLQGWNEFIIALHAFQIMFTGFQACRISYFFKQLCSCGFTICSADADDLLIWFEEFEYVSKLQDAYICFFDEIKDLGFFRQAWRDEDIIDFLKEGLWVSAIIYLNIIAFK